MAQLTCPNCGTVSQGPNAPNVTAVTCPKCRQKFDPRNAVRTGNKQIDDRINAQRAAAARDDHPPPADENDHHTGAYVRAAREARKAAAAARRADDALAPHNATPTPQNTAVPAAGGPVPAGTPPAGVPISIPPTTPPPFGLANPAAAAAAAAAPPFGLANPAAAAAVAAATPPGSDPTRLRLDGGQQAPGYDDNPVRLLQQIRDAIRALGGGYNAATGQTGAKKPARGLDDDETKKFWSRAGGLEDLVTVLAQPSAGESQSGSNLGGFARTLAGIWKKRRRGLGGQKILSTHAAHIPDPSSGARPPGSTPAPGDGSSPHKSPSVREKVTGETPAEQKENDSWSGVIKKTARGLSNLAIGLVEAGKAAYGFARAQEKEIRRLAEVGGAQAAAVAILDVNRIKRDIRTAGDTADTSTGLTKSIDRFEDALRPVEALATNIANVAAGGLLDLLTSAVDLLGDAADGITQIATDLGLWKADDKRKEMKKLPATQIENIIKNQEKQDRPMWPSGPPGAPTGPSVSSPFHGGL